MPLCGAQIPAPLALQRGIQAAVRAISDHLESEARKVEGKKVERPGVQADNEPGFFGRLWPF